METVSTNENEEFLRYAEETKAIFGIDVNELFHMIWNSKLGTAMIILEKGDYSFTFDYYKSPFRETAVFKFGSIHGTRRFEITFHDKLRR